jgi:IS605 OrfB family transposase
VCWKPRIFEKLSAKTTQPRIINKKKSHLSDWPSLKGLRNREKKEGRGRGRKFNKKLSWFPYFKFTEYLTYKAALAGIKVIKILENWTSQTCRKCNQRGTRMTQGLFVCKTCDEENADRNASFNISYRALGYISKVWVTVNIPITLASTDRSTMMTRETRERLPVYDR